MHSRLSEEGNILNFISHRCPSTINTHKSTEGHDFKIEMMHFLESSAKIPISNPIPTLSGEKSKETNETNPCLTIDRSRDKSWRRGCVFLTLIDDPIYPETRSELTDSATSLFDCPKNGEKSIGKFRSIGDENCFSSSVHLVVVGLIIFRVFNLGRVRMKNRLSSVLFFDRMVVNIDWFLC